MCQPPTSLLPLATTLTPPQARAHTRCVLPPPRLDPGCPHRHMWSGDGGRGVRTRAGMCAVRCEPSWTAPTPWTRWGPRARTWRLAPSPATTTLRSELGAGVRLWWADAGIWVVASAVQADNITCASCAFPPLHVLALHPLLDPILMQCVCVPPSASTSLSVPTPLPGTYHLHHLLHTHCHHCHPQLHGRPGPSHPPGAQGRGAQGRGAAGAAHQAPAPLAPPSNDEGGGGWGAWGRWCCGCRYVREAVWPASMGGGDGLL